ncbi:GAF and ANTAR domain-containing protein [Streptomyces sp. SGAir0957]
MSTITGKLQITESAHDLVGGCDAAGILLLENNQARTLAPTEHRVVEYDRLQAQLGEGPCFDAARRTDDERVYRIRDLGDEPRWPHFVPPAHRLGIGSMMGFPLFTDDEDYGALNFYSRRPGAFTDVGEAAAWLLASHAAVALASARTHAQMEQAITTRHHIGEAMGILMARPYVTEDQAFDWFACPGAVTECGRGIRTARRATSSSLSRGRARSRSVSVKDSSGR